MNYFERVQEEFQTKGSTYLDLFLLIKEADSKIEKLEKQLAESIPGSEVVSLISSGYLAEIVGTSYLQGMIKISDVKKLLKGGD